LPATSKAQQKWAYAKLAEAKAGDNKTGMTLGQLAHFTKRAKK
jgi:hypothetical protein